ncbi:MAG TPA: SRPBCC family protein [Nonomuraea sp.]|nr:SRPBCC family protein [Nonomuraea sp.]
MPINCVCRATIKASPADCFTALADTRGWADWVRDLDRMDVLDPGEAGRPARVRASATLGGYEHQVVLDVVADPDAGSLTLDLVEGAGLEAIRGALGFSPVAGGALMAADIRITLAKNRPARIERMLSRRIETALTRDFVRHVARQRRG